MKEFLSTAWGMYLGAVHVFAAVGVFTVAKVIYERYFQEKEETK